MDRRMFSKIVAIRALTPIRHSSFASAFLGPTQGTELFDVRRYGAAGDGTANDTDAFSRAIAAAAPSGGTTFVPAGQYRLTRPLHLPSGVGLKGVGPTSIISHVDGDLEVIVAVNSTSIAIEDLSIQGRFGFGVVIHRSKSIAVSRCHISGGTVPRYGYSGGVMVVGSSAVTVRGCQISGNGGDAYIQGSDIQCDGLGDTSSDIRILDNQCTSSDVAVNIRCYDTSRSEIRGNTARGARIRGAQNHGYGILVYPTLPNPDACFENIIAGNTVTNTQGSGIYLVRSPRSLVEDNQIEDVATVQSDVTLPVAGVALNQSEYVSVLRNTILRSGRAGVSIASNKAGVGHVEVRNNIITATGGYGVHLRGTLVDIHATNNTISDAAGGIGGDTSDAQDDIEISYNTLSRIRGTGIRLGNSLRARVDDNIVRDCAGYAIDLSLHDDVSGASRNDVQDSAKTWEPGHPMSRVVYGDRPAP